MNKCIIYGIFIIAFTLGYSCSYGLPLKLEENWSVYDYRNANHLITINLPGKWNSLTLNNNDCLSIVTLKRQFVWDDRYNGKLILYLGRIAIIDEIYINGTCIGKTGIMPDDLTTHYDFMWLKERIYSFNSSILTKGKNTIEIKVFSHYINGIEKVPVIYTYEEWETKNRWQILIPDLNNLNAPLVALVLFVFFVPLSRGVGKSSIIGYIFVFMISVFILNFLLMPVIQFSNNIWRFKLFYVSYMVTDFFLVVTLGEFFRIKNKKVNIFFLIILIVVTAIICYMPSTFSLVHHGMRLLVTVLILYISYSLYLFIKAFIKDPRRYWYVNIIAIVVLFSAVKTYYIIITQSLYELPMSMMLRLPLLVATALVVYLFDIKNIKFERDSLLTALIHRTKQVQRLERLFKSNQKPGPREVIVNVKEYLDTHFNEPYNRAMLAKKFCIHEDYMCQLFKKVTHMSIAQYINMKRIEMAKQLLVDTESKVIDIAFHVGFDNLTYFYRSFKQFTGQTPVEYRKSLDTIKTINYNIEDEAF